MIIWLFFLLVLVAGCGLPKDVEILKGDFVALKAQAAEQGEEITRQGEGFAEVRAGLEQQGGRLSAMEATEKENISRFVALEKSQKVARARTDALQRQVGKFTVSTFGGDRRTFEVCCFAAGSSELTVKMKQKLEGLKKEGWETEEVIGTASLGGADEDNYKLSYDRALAAVSVVGGTPKAVGPTDSFGGMKISNQAVIVRLVRTTFDPGVPTAEGFRGPRGYKGDPGKDGIDGTDGRDGIDGRDPRDGRDGRDGVCPAPCPPAVAVCTPAATVCPPPVSPAPAVP